MAVIGREVGRPGNTVWLPVPRITARYQRECAARAESRAKRQGFTEETEE